MSAKSKSYVFCMAVAILVFGADITTARADESGGDVFKAPSIPVVKGRSIEPVKPTPIDPYFAAAITAYHARPIETYVARQVQTAASNSIMVIGQARSIPIYTAPTTKIRTPEENAALMRNTMAGYSTSRQKFKGAVTNQAQAKWYAVMNHNISVWNSGQPFTQSWSQFSIF